MFHGVSMTNGNNSLRFEDSAMSSSIHHHHHQEDTGFCSGEDYMEQEIHSPTDSSEDSVEVKVSTITLNNKRKLEETPAIFSGPLKKRMCLKVQAEANNNHVKTPFRPWSPPKSSNFAVPFPRIKVETPMKVENFSYFRPPSPVQQQTEPLPLVIKREKLPEKTDIRVPQHPQVGKMTIAETERMILKTNEQFPGLKPTTTTFNETNSRKNNLETKREQRNYKNMTRERRIEANARERTRVHTISAAFDTLRQSVPAYSNNQKLSKLSVLRIACSYIMTLSSLVNDSSDSSEPTTSECVDLVSRTIQREGKLRKKKDDND